MKRILYIILAGILLLAVSCVKEETPETYLQILQSDVNFTAAGGPGEILISTNASEVSASSDKSWLTVGTAGTESVLFTVEESGEAFSRIANVTISAGGQSQEVSISQMGLIFTVSSDEIASGFEIDPEGGSVSFGFSTSGISDPTVTIPEADSWLESSIQDGQIILSAEINLSGSDRSTTVSVGSGWKTFEFPVSQSVIPILEQTTFEFSRDAVSGQEVAITEYVSEDMVWSVTTDDTWITAEKTATGILFSLEENTSGALRTGTISMLDADNNVIETITISQRIYSYDFFLGTWLLTYVPYRGTQQTTEIVTLTADETRTNYILTGSNVIFVSATLTYDDSDASMFWGAQYLGEMGSNGHIWWCPYTTNGYYTWNTSAGLVLTYNMNESQQVLTFNQMYLDEESGSTCGFFLFGFDTQNPADGQETPTLYDGIIQLISMTRISSSTGE